MLAAIGVGLAIGFVVYALCGFNRARYKEVWHTIFAIAAILAALFIAAVVIGAIL